MSKCAQGAVAYRGLLLPAALMVVIMLAACDFPMLPTPTQAVPSPTPGSGTDSPAAVLVVYGVSGGIAGFRRVLTISEQGDARLTDKGEEMATRELNAATLDRLRALFRAANFFELQEQYDRGNVADDIYKTITYAEGGRSKVVTVASAGGEGLTPPALDRLVAALGEVERAVREGTVPTIVVP